MVAADGGAHCIIDGARNRVEDDVKNHQQDDPPDPIPGS